MMEQQEKLMARVIDIFAQTFDKKAVLRGGMVLRLLGAPRCTNDLDYLFVPYRSKKDIVDGILDCLKQIEGAQVSYSMNSKCLRVVVATDEATIQVEAKVAMQTLASPITTRNISAQYGLPSRIINIVELSVALANKLAAWNERRLIRDIYDICFYLQMNISPDEKTLLQRLKKPIYSRLVGKNDHFTGSSLTEFYTFLRQKCADLNADDIRAELSGYLPSDEIDGLDLLFRAALTKLS